MATASGPLPPERAPAIARWIRRLALAGVLLGFTVVVLGAYVRLTAAGLGCPDWPGCYGHVTPLGAEQSLSAQSAFPARPLEVGKAWREMIHRYAASTLGLIVVSILALAVLGRRSRVLNMRYAFALLALILFQGMLGMFTVTWQLKPLIVTAHLIFGLTTLAVLWWLWLTLRMTPTPAPTTPADRVALAAQTPSLVHTAWHLALIGLAALAVQITLGGWTSSNYAATACPDFPRCQNAWLPPTDFRDAFVFWHGRAVNYEGGVLANPARVAIHLTHRVGALIATLALCLAAGIVLTRPALARYAVPAMAVVGALGLQLAIGVTMVLYGFPLWLATAHNAGAALLLLSVLALLRVLSGAASRQAF